MGVHKANDGTKIDHGWTNEQGCFWKLELKIDSRHFQSLMSKKFKREIKSP